MLEEKLQKWSNEFMQAWKDADTDKILSLLSNNVRYYEDIFEEPLIGKKEVKPLWDVVKINQKVHSYKNEVIYSDNKGGIIHWTLTRASLPSGEEQEFNGVFEVHLNENNECEFFRMWRHLRAS
jgi:hypothetical protein